MKKTSLLLICAIMLSIFKINASANSNELHWYVKRREGHLPPIAERNMDFLSEYDSYYLDNNAAEKNEKVMYLTFDAGYENGNIKTILDILKDEGIPAAFFVLSHLVESNTDLIMRMQNEGHLVCNHSASHKDMTKLSRDDFQNELQKMEEIVMRHTGKAIDHYFRPPKGYFNEENLKWAQELGYKTVFWSLCYADWDNQKQPSTAYAVKLLLDNTHPGAIILLHPTSATNVSILPTLIAKWRKEGYTFASIDQIL